MRTPSKKKAHLFIKTQYENNRNMLTCLKINTNMKRLDRKTERNQPASQSVKGGLVDIKGHSVAGEVGQVEGRCHGNEASSSLQDGQQPLCGSGQTV